MLAFSGGTVHGNPGAKPDIDLFVVAAADHAYTAYALLVLATKLTGTRDIVCPNYVIDENELTIAYHHDLFTAHQLVSARPISGLGVYLEVCRANEAWVQQFFAGFRPRAAAMTLGWPRLQRFAELTLSPIESALEGLCRGVFRVHLRRQIAQAPRTDVVLADGILKLHLSDYRQRVLERFAARLDSLRNRAHDADAELEGDASTSSLAGSP
jgi:hypothetical protein